MWFLPAGSGLVPPRSLPGEAGSTPRTPTRPARTNHITRIRAYAAQSPQSHRTRSTRILRGSAAPRELGQDAVPRSCGAETEGASSSPRTPRTPREPRRSTPRTICSRLRDLHQTGGPTMHRKARLLAALSALIALPGSLPAQQAARKALVGGTLIDGYGGPPIRNSVIIVEGERIARV